MPIKGIQMLANDAVLKENSKRCFDMADQNC
jgi:hypothetical protein